MVDKMKVPELTKEEIDLLLRALDYFKREEEKEIAELSIPGGNKAYIPECRNRLLVYESLIRKFRSLG